MRCEAGISRYLKKDKLIHPPPLMEGEAIASRVLELGPAGAKFLGPVIIEVPHFASLRGREREIVILRSDNGETWREHTLEATEEAVQEVLQDSFDEGGEEEEETEDREPALTTFLFQKSPSWRISTPTGSPGSSLRTSRSISPSSPGSDRRFTLSAPRAASSTPPWCPRSRQSSPRGR